MALSLLAPAHLPQRCPDALLGQTGLTLPFALPALEALHRGEKPGCLWLAIDHGDCSFRECPCSDSGHCGGSAPSCAPDETPPSAIPIFRDPRNSASKRRRHFAPANQPLPPSL